MGMFELCQIYILHGSAQVYVGQISDFQLRAGHYILSFYKISTFSFDLRQLGETIIILNLILHVTI